MSFLQHFLKQKNVRHWLSLLTLMALSVTAVNLNYSTTSFLSSVTSYKADPFDGTVMPIQQVPNWSGLASGESTLKYADLSSSKLIDIPTYRNDYFTYESSKLVWGDAKSAVIRNTKITYPVPYAGSYELGDLGEYAGSHPAVDIKTLQGTPIHAIANGVVETAGSSSTWGNYVVIVHKNVPDPNNATQKTTLYSCYAHMDTLFVKEGAVVSKGKVIGEVGETGTATTYHLHFQIDKVDAPWHPYWPFTSAEAKAAGYSFWEAVSAGVGQDNVYRYTANPLAYVQEHLDESATSTEGDEESQVDEEADGIEEESEPTESSSSETESTQEDTSTNTTNNESSDLTERNFDHIKITVPPFTQPGQNPSIQFDLVDANGDTVKDAQFDGKIQLKVKEESVGSLSQSTLKNSAFTKGTASVNFYADHAGDTTVTATLDEQSNTSDVIHVISTIEPFAKFGIVHDGYFVPGKTETVQVQALDLDGNPTPAFYGEGSIELKVIQGNGILTPSTLSKKDLVTGVANIAFTGSSTDDVILEVIYGKKVLESDTLVARLFNDFDASKDYYEAVSYLYRSGVVSGYPDGTFQASRTVSRVEALKFIFAGMDQALTDGLSVSYKDTRMDQWYSSYLASASKRGIVQGYPDGNFKPTQGINRVEFLKMLFNTVDLNVDPIVTEDPYNDVDKLSWYAPYVQFAKEKNLFPSSGRNFDPSSPMSRVEVAEVIYRMITVMDNGLGKYSALEKPKDY